MLTLGLLTEMARGQNRKRKIPELMLKFFGVLVVVFRGHSGRKQTGSNSIDWRDHQVAGGALHHIESNQLFLVLEKGTLP